MLGYYFIKLFSKFLCYSPKFIRCGIANFFGFLAVSFCPKWRFDMAKANIQECLVLGKDDAEKIVKESLHRFGRMIVEVLRFPVLNKRKFDEIVTVEGLEYLQNAYQGNRGVVMTTAHFGNWELFGATVALMGYPLVSIVRHQNNGAMNRLVNEYREMVGQEIAYNRGENNFFKIVRLLKSKHFIGVLYDQDTNDIGVRFDLFGKSCIVPDGAAALSRINKAPIVPINFFVFLFQIP